MYFNSSSLGRVPVHTGRDFSIADCCAEVMMANIAIMRLPYHSARANQGASAIDGHENTPITAAADKVL